MNNEHTVQEKLERQAEFHAADDRSIAYQDPAAVVAEYRASKGDDSKVLKPELAAAMQRATDTTLEVRAEQAARKDPVAAALAAHNAGRDSIHSAYRAQLENEENPPQGENAQSSTESDFDPAQFAAELGFDADAVAREGWQNYDDAAIAIFNDLEQLEKVVPDAEMVQLVTTASPEVYEAIGKIGQAVVEALDKAASPSLGRTLDGNLTDAQHKRRFEIATDVLRQTLAAKKLGRTPAPIATLIKRARLKIDDHFEPGRVGAQPERIKSENTFSNIHEAYAATSW